MFAGGDVCVAGHDSGPVFEEQPTSLIYPEGLSEGKVTLSCQARANPAASYRWVTHTVHTHRHARMHARTPPLNDVVSKVPSVTDD